MSDRKIGNNKKSCAAYKAANRLEKNKARRKKTHAARVARIAARIADRVANGKTVNKKHGSDTKKVTR